MALASPTWVSAALNGAMASNNGYVSLHIASPSTTGANEMASVTRQAAAWSTSSSGSPVTNTGAISWSTPNTVAATHVGTFSASTAGTFGIGLPLGSSVQAATITAAIGALSVAGS